MTAHGSGPKTALIMPAGKAAKNANVGLVVSIVA